MNQFTKHEIVIGRNVNGSIERPLLSGHSFLNVGDSFYCVKLFMFPNQTYYLVKNQNSATRYTLFAKQVIDERGQRFQNPVGMASLIDNSMHLELYFPVLRAQMYMSLFPSAS